MFRRSGNDSKNNRSAAKDDNVRKEAQLEEKLDSVLSMGNEAAGNNPPQVPLSIGNETMNGLLNDHYADDLLQFPERNKGGLIQEIIEQDPDMQTRIGGKPKKKQKRSGRNAGRPSAPFKVNAPMQDLASPGQKLGSARGLNVEDLLRKQQEEKDKFRIIEIPHDDNRGSMDDDEDARSKISIRSIGLKPVPVPEADPKRPVKKSPSGGMREAYDDGDEDDIIPDFSDDEEIKTGRNRIKKADLHIPEVDLFASYIDEEERFRDEDEEIEEKKEEEKAAEAEEDADDTYGIEEDLIPHGGPKNGRKNRRKKKRPELVPGLSKADVAKEANVQKWLGKFFMDRVKPKKKEFQMIIRGLYRAMKAGESGKVKYDNMRDRIADMLCQILINRNFKSDATDKKEAYAKVYMANYTYTLGTNKDFEFSGVLNSMIASCMREGRKMPQDRMVS